MKQILPPLVAALIVFSCGQSGREPASQGQTLIQNSGQETAVSYLTTAREKLAAGKAKLAQSGKYDCCLADPCNHCALAESSCTCAADLKAGDAVCNECYGGWQEGKGDVPNIRKENVKADFMGHEKKN